MPEIPELLPFVPLDSTHSTNRQYSRDELPPSPSPWARAALRGASPPSRARRRGREANCYIKRAMCQAARAAAHAKNTYLAAFYTIGGCAYARIAQSGDGAGAPPDHNRVPRAGARRGIRRAGREPLAQRRRTEKHRRAQERAQTLETACSTLDSAFKGEQWDNETTEWAKGILLKTGHHTRNNW